MSEEKPFDPVAWILARELAEIDENADLANDPMFSYFYEVMINDT